MASARSKNVAAIGMRREGAGEVDDVVYLRTVSRASGWNAATSFRQVSVLAFMAGSGKRIQVLITYAAVLSL